MKTQWRLLDYSTLVKKPRLSAMIMDHYRVQHSSSGNDDASLSLVPTGRYMVELSKFFCKINWLLLSIYTLYYY